MVNTAFVNNLDHIDNLTETLKVPILMNISLKASIFDSNLLMAPKTPKDFIHQYKQKKFLIWKKGMSIWTQICLTKISFLTVLLYMFFLFVTAVISVLVMTFAIYLLCKHKKLRMLVTSLALQQIKEVGKVTKQEDVTTACTCKIQFYIIFVLNISIFGLVTFTVLHSQKLKLCRGPLFSNAFKIILFICDVQYYVPIKLCKTEGSIYLFKITGTLVLTM